MRGGRSWSIRARLTAWTGAVLAAILVGLGLTVYLAMDRALLERIDADLAFEFEETAERVRTGAVDGSGAEALPAAFREAYRFRIDGPDGRLRLGTPAMAGPAPMAVPADDGPRFATIELPGAGRHRLVAGAVAGPGGPWALRIASPTADHDRELAELRAVLLAILPAGLGIAVVAGYVLAGRSLAPVDRMTEAARRITGRNLHERLAVANPGDELGRLAGTLNAMLDRLDRTLAATRRFTADAAHELRTPVATLRTEAEVALAGDRTPEALAEVLASVVEEADRLGRLADRLLRLSREDAGLVADELRPVRLDEAVAAAVARSRSAADRAGVDLRADALPPCSVLADPDRLREVLDNLLDNAVKYNRPGGAVRVAGRIEDGAAVVEVADTGVGIDPESQAHVFDRFYRADPSRSRRTGGFGLGLSIARAAVERLGGRIELESEPGEGSTFRVALPMSPGDRHAVRNGMFGTGR